MRVLIIKSNPKPSKYSITLSALEYFLEQFKSSNTDVVIDEIDVSAYKHLCSESLRDYRNPDGNIAKIAKEFASYDRYIFASPMWNLSIPSGLKAYIDHLVIPGVTFKQERGNPKPVGLLEGKKVVFITSSGGDFASFPMDEWEHNVNYMKHIMEHIGITDFNYHYIPMAHRRGMSPKERLEEELDGLKQLAMKW